jgi:hypothetical protein
MTLARLLAAALLICCLPAFAQDQQPRKLPVIGGPYSGSIIPPVSDFGAAGTTPSEPWKIIPNRPADLGSGHNPLDRMRLDQRHFQQGMVDASTRTFNLKDPSEGQLDADTTCYTIRSYVVARDSKDSDSTHPAGYSTCRPSDRYHVKSADIRVESADR